MAHPKYLLTILMLSLLGTASAQADPEAIETGKVVIKGTRGPALKPYRTMAAGLDAFDEHHALAPAAPELRFRLRPLNGNAKVDMDLLGLRIAGDTISIPLPLAPDDTFTLPRSAAAIDEEADVVLNKKQGGYQVLVQSAGLPTGMDRLGDLRLECQVAVAIGKRELNFMQRALAATVMGSTDWCSSDKMKWGRISPRPIGSATLVDGPRRIALEVNKDRRSYAAPTHDRQYADDTLIEVTYADAI